MTNVIPGCTCFACSGGDPVHVGAYGIGKQAGPNDGDVVQSGIFKAAEAYARKATPVTTGVLDYFPDAVREIARVSKAGNDQHNPGQPLHWAKEKSKDHADCLVRHLLDRGTLDTDGQRHTAKVAWRALALLQTEIEQERTK